jgi:hypothetical protein
MKQWITFSRSINFGDHSLTYRGKLANRGIWKLCRPILHGHVMRTMLLSVMNAHFTSMAADSPVAD